MTVYGLKKKRRLCESKWNDTIKERDKGVQQRYDDNENTVR